MLQQQEFLPEKAKYGVEREKDVSCMVNYNGGCCRDKLRMCQSMQTTGKLQLSPDMVYDFTSEDLQDLGEIGRGGFGTVNKMIHRISNTVMAVKVIYEFLSCANDSFVLITFVYKSEKLLGSTFREFALPWTKENKSNC